METSEEIKPVLAFGELLWDLLPSGKVLGGAPANFGFRLHSLGVPAAIVSRVGADPLGDEALAVLHQAGLDTSGIQNDTSFSTGTVAVTFDKEGDAAYDITPAVAYDHIEATEPLRDLFRQCRAVCFGTLAQRNEKTRETLYELLALVESGVRVVDINLRRNCFSRETVLRSLIEGDVLKLNDTEVGIVNDLLGLGLPTISNFAQGVSSRFNLSACIVTRGPNGVYACGMTGEEVDIPGIPVKVEDTVGSGDAFTAAFVKCFLAGRPLLECCRAGNALGAAVAATKGGMTEVSYESALALLE